MWGKNGARQEYDAVCHRLSHWLKESFFPHPPPLNKPLTTAISQGLFLPCLFHTQKDDCCGSDSLRLVCLKSKRENVPLFPTIHCWCTERAPDFNYQDATLCCCTGQISTLCFVWTLRDRTAFTTQVAMRCLMGKSFPHAISMQLSTLALCKKDHSCVAL